MTRKKLLAVIEFLNHSKLPALYQRLGFEVAVEWQERKAIPLVRKLTPDVLVADFYAQTDFRDRLSNLESLLATAQPMTETKILVFYEPRSQAALDKVRARLRIDAAMTTPVDEGELQRLLESWLQR
jgi:hypothetical protein